MGKGGYEKRRLAQKRERERQARRRQQRNKRFTQALVIMTILALIGGVTFAIVSGGDEDLTSKKEPEACTTPGPATQGKKSFPSPPCMTIDTAKTYTATMKTSLGTIKVRLLAKEAPETVNSFVFLAKQRFYDGSLFHRVIPDFGGEGSDMVQGGDAVKRDGTGDAGYKFDDENTIAFDKPGYLAMANSGLQPDGSGTNGSQFFFLSGKVEHLNRPGTCPAQPGQQASCHSVFGEVIEGLAVVKKIADVPQDPENNKPKKDVLLVTVTIEEK